MLSGVGVDSEYQKMLYSDFRNGLIHEARIKNVARFDSELEYDVVNDGVVWTVNPRWLLSLTKAALDRLTSLDDETFEKNARPLLKEDFQEEITANSAVRCSMHAPELLIREDRER